MEKFGVKEVCDVTFIDLVTNKPVLHLDTLKVSNLENTADESHATGGKGNPKLLTWNFNRGATMTVTDALMSVEAIAMVAGTSVVTGVTTVYGRKVLPVAANKVTLPDTPTTGSVTVFNAAGVEVTGFTVATKDVTTTAATPTVANGDVVTVYYTYSTDATAQTISIQSDKFPGFYKVIGDTLVRNEATGEDEPFQVILEKAKLKPGFTLTMQADGDPSTFEMGLELYKPANGTEMIKLIKHA